MKMYFSKTFFQHFLIIVLFTAPIRALLTQIISPDTTVDKREGRSWRLPNTTYPLKYHLHITTWIHREIYNFSGNVTIELMVKESTSELVLHAKDLQIQRIFIEDLSTKQKIANLHSRVIDDLLVIDVKNNTNLSDDDIFISGHLLRLEIHYVGVIKENNFGFQTIIYKAEKKKTIYGAYTHMEPTFARKVLPCYDEPGLKANFSVRITHGSNYTAISNMPAITTWINAADNMTTTTFLETPKMCSYLLAFMVSTNIKHISKNVDGIWHRVFKPTNSKDRGELALANSIKAIQTFGRYMDIRYSLPKIDHVDVDLNIYAGMENWGLITYASNVFVQTKMEKDFFQINTQIHEIVHQWFGNLVSPTWWDSIWLNEGLTSYYSYRLTAMLYPELKAMKEHIYDNCFTLFSQPIVEYVEEPNDISRMFGSTVYSKAPCLLNLLSKMIGEETFHRGAKDYLKTHTYSSAKGDQFFHHLQTAMDSSNETIWKFNVSEIMKPWFTTTTVPEFFISRNYSNNNIIYIKQMLREIASNGTKQLWGIPMNFATMNSKDFESVTYYMPPIPEITLNLQEFNIKLRKSDTLLVTIPGIAFYYVCYDDENLLQIAKTLQKNPNSIDKMNRVVIVRSINKLWTEKSALVPKLEFLKYLRQEQDYLVWEAISDAVLSFSNVLGANVRSSNLLEKFLRNIVATQYKKFYKIPVKKLSFEKFKMLRTLTKLACNLNLDACLSKSRQQFLAHKKQNFEKVNTYYDQFEICYAAKTFNNKEFVETLKYLKNALANSTKIHWEFLYCTNSGEQYKEFLNALRDIPTNKNERNKRLSFWTNLLTLANANTMKFNSTYNFLIEQIPKLQTFSNATYNLCSRMASKAEDIRAQFQLQYINLMKLCMNEILMKDGEFESRIVVPNLKRIGANYIYEKYPLWQQKVDEAQKWLEEEETKEIL